MKIIIIILWREYKILFLDWQVDFNILIPEEKPTIPVCDKPQFEFLSIINGNTDERLSPFSLFLFPSLEYTSNQSYRWIFDGSVCPIRWSADGARLKYYIIHALQFSCTDSGINEQTLYWKIGFGLICFEKL